MYIPNSNMIIQQKLATIQKRIPINLRLQYTTFDNILESQSKKTEIEQPNTTVVSSKSSRYDVLIKQLSTKYEVDPSLVKSMIKAESDFDSNAVSSAGAQGLMQLMPKTSASLGVENPFDPIENIDGGIRYIKKLLNYYDGDVSLALAGYNSGPGNVKKYGGVPPFKETQEYINRVTSYHASIKEIF